LLYWPLRVGYQSLIINCLKPLAAGQDVAIFCKQTQGLRVNSEIFLLGVTKHFLPTDFIPLGISVNLDVKDYSLAAIWEDRHYDLPESLLPPGLIATYRMNKT
jgi:hypothetical protein